MTGGEFIVYWYRDLSQEIFIKKAILFLAALAFVLFAALAAGLEVEYKDAPVIDNKVTVYKYSEDFYLVDLYNINGGYYSERPHMLFGAMAVFERDNPELMISDYGPVFYGSDGDVYYYWFRTVPRNTTT